MLEPTINIGRQIPYFGKIANDYFGYEIYQSKNVAAINLIII